MRFDEFRTQANDTFPTVWEFSDTPSHTFRSGARPGGCVLPTWRRSYAASTDLITLDWDDSINRPLEVSVEATDSRGAKVIKSFRCRTMAGAKLFLDGMEPELSAALDGPKVPEGKTP